MEADLIRETKSAMHEADNYMIRGSLERSERWLEIAREIPFLRFPADWEVAVIPPFGGAVSRFLVRRGDARVSVYCDYYDKLGAMWQPYWEIHPDDSLDGCGRFLLAETDELLSGIAASLDAQDARDSDTHRQAET